MINTAQCLAADAFRSRGTSARHTFADSLVGAVLAVAARLASTLVLVDELVRPTRSARLRKHLSHIHGGATDGSSELRSIWFARIAREGLRVLLALGFTDAVLRRVVVTGRSGGSQQSCVYAIYHTVWGRVLALWLAHRSDGMLYSARRWLDRAGNAHVPCTWRGLRELVVRIRRGSSAAVTADHFGPASAHTVPVTLLGRDVHVSTGIARIAAAAGVPVVPVMTRFSAGKLQVVLASEIHVDDANLAGATARITAAFDTELRKDPSAWEKAHRFLSTEPAV